MAKRCPKPAKCCAPAARKCCAPKAGCCDKGKGCCDKGKGCCNADPCEIAKLIYASQTSCYAKDRRSAIHELGDDYDCTCNPEIMVAFIYALNDADERVRAKAADEIGDQLRKHGSACGEKGCCTKEVVAALTAALGDCDKKVRGQAVEGLEACGYEVVDGNCECVSCDPCEKQWNKGTPSPAPQKSAPPTPGTEKVYAPARLRRIGSPRRSRLSNLFGLLN